MNKWLVISYKLPSEPSRLRVHAWRSLKKMGAINIQQSLWYLPFSDANYKVFSQLAAELETNGGEVLIMNSVLETKYEQIVIDTFNKAREIEYEEILDKCEDYFKEIEKEIKVENFTFAEAEENEEELEKLKSWFQKVKARDIFHSPLEIKTKQVLNECVEVFNIFNDKVYEYENKVD